MRFELDVYVTLLEWVRPGDFVEVVETPGNPEPDEKSALPSILGMLSF